MVAHLKALAGKESSVRLVGEYADLLLTVMPLADELGEVTCSISILSNIIA